MSNPAELHAPSIELPSPVVHEAEILDDAMGPGVQVRCVIDDLDRGLATDPCSFAPLSTPAGWFYPKKGNRAIVVQHDDGPDAIVAWWPAADAVPDHAA